MKNNIFGAAACAGIAILFTVASTSILSSRTFSDNEAADSDVENAQSYAAAAAEALAAPHGSYLVASSTPQFVLLSFDGSKSIDMLQETLDFEKKMDAEDKPLRFTYFVNAVYFLSKENAQMYQAPRKPRGLSNIGFARSPADVAHRVQIFNAAVAAGNEVASHSAGHFDGTDWSYDEWKQEFSSFASLMDNIQRNNPAALEAPAFGAVIGFRAPQLGANDALYRAERDSGFVYDASGVGSPGIWPHKDPYGIWHVPLGTVFVGAQRSPAVAMDYSLWMHQSGAENKDLKNTPLWTHDLNEVEAAYLDYFQKNYEGDRAPVVIGDHFAKWNDGVYWEAMKAFAENVCGLPHVRCATFKELTDYLNTSGVPEMIKKE